MDNISLWQSYEPSFSCPCEKEVGRGGWGGGGWKGI